MGVASDDTAATDPVTKAGGTVVALLSVAGADRGGGDVIPWEIGGPWIATGRIEGTVALPGLDVVLPLAELYQGLTFAGGG